jgi:hypothetical protein
MRSGVSAASGVGLIVSLPSAALTGVVHDAAGPLGAAAIGFEVYEKVSQGHLDQHKLLLVVANLLAGLTIVAGLERFIHFSSIEKQLSTVGDQTSQILKNVSVQLAHSTRVIQGYDFIYDDSIRLVLTAQRSVKALLVGVPQAPTSFRDALAEHLKANPSVSYEGVFLIGKLEDEFWTVVDARLAYYKEHGIKQEQVNFSVVKSGKPIGFDVLVIDERHAALAFSPMSMTDNRRTMAISFENQPDIAVELARWFNSMPNKISYDDSRTTYMREQHKKISQGAN